MARPHKYTGLNRGRLESFGQVGNSFQNRKSLGKQFAGFGVLESSRRWKQ